MAIVSILHMLIYQNNNILLVAMGHDNNIPTMQFGSEGSRVLQSISLCSHSLRKLGNSTMMHCLYTLQEENFHWILNYDSSLMENSPNLNSLYYYVFGNFSMIAYIIEIQKSRIFTSMNFINLSQVAKLSSVIFSPGSGVLYIYFFR